LRLGRAGPLTRPFCQRAQISPCGYSTLLQRAITDFGAEEAFGQINGRLHEHYGITVPTSSARQITLRHARQAQALRVTTPAPPAIEQVITEIDGSLVPLVEPTAPVGAGAQDRRRQKRLFWKEVRLCAAIAVGRTRPCYGATLGTTVEAGLLWEQTAQRVGVGPHSRVHGVGDGAEWIAEQFALRFGAQGRYLVDFYHASEYLAAAAVACARRDPQAWRQRQQRRLKTNQLDAVLAALTPHVEPVPTAPPARHTNEASLTPVRDCERYLRKRRDQLDYAGALAAGLPIGSGLIESGHRHVVQRRLKRPGAWWTEANARAMVALRVQRANGDWSAYWQAIPNLHN